MKTYRDFDTAIKDLTRTLIERGHVLRPNHWQSTDVSSNKAAETLELLTQSFQVAMTAEDLITYQDDIKPNLPWADRHFELERVSGHPLNPGETWREWPWGLSADKFRKEGEAFHHSYAERYWPKFAGMTEGGILPSDTSQLQSRVGIRYPYGDLDDVVNRLVKDPLTRQAVLAVWHPEDQGTGVTQRVPCSLTYQFIMRYGYLHTIYSIRSCDALRHFPDDIYLTVRLVLWVLTKLRELDDYWQSVKPGFFTMHITSLHCFRGDLERLRERLK